MPPAERRTHRPRPGTEGPALSTSGRKRSTPARRPRPRARGGGPAPAEDERRRRTEQMARVGEVAAKLVHDLKNPLAAILSGLQILERDEGLPAARRPLVARTATQVRELVALASGFLESARPPRPVPRLLSAQQAIREALEPMKALAAGRRVRLEPVLPGEPVLLALDPSEFRRALGNLVLNAIEASPEGGRVAVELAALSASDRKRRLPGFSGEVAAIRVRDQGPGLSPRGRARLFEPFYSTKTSGTGLGLPIALEIVEAHGGVMAAGSAPGVGATFEILLPSGPRPRCMDSARCDDCSRCPVLAAGAGFCCWAVRARASAGSATVTATDCQGCGYFRRYNLGAFVRNPILEES